MRVERSGALVAVHRNAVHGRWNALNFLCYSVCGETVGVLGVRLRRSATSLAGPYLPFRRESL